MGYYIDTDGQVYRYEIVSGLPLGQDAIRLPDGRLVDTSAGSPATRRLFSVPPERNWFLKWDDLRQAWLYDPRQIYPRHEAYWLDTLEVKSF